jgi:GT2 family glycosyltransferase
MSYSIVICSRNIDNLRQCVSALRAAGETGRVIVVWDFGGEGYGIRAIPATGDPNIRAIEGIHPFSFARNCNIGIRAAGEYDVVLLNDDALYTTEFGFSIAQMDCRTEPDIGMIGATTDVTGYTFQHPEARKKQFRPVEFFAFVCVYIPRRTLDTVGLLDERFSGPGVYGGEDVDYCLRVRDAGLKVGVSDYCYVDHSKLQSTFRGPHPRNGAPGDIAESNRIGIEKWGEKWPHRGK